MILWLAAASAATLTVPGDAPTIEAAVAMSAPGDVILLTDSGYKIADTLRIHHPLSIIGAGAAKTWIVPSDVPAVMIDTTADLQLGGLTLWGDQRVAGVAAAQADTLVLKDVVIAETTAALTVDQVRSVDLGDVELLDNVGDAGAQLLLSRVDDASITRLWAAGGVSAHGSPIEFLDVGPVTIADSLFADHLGDVSGALAVTGAAGDLHIAGSRFLGNLGTRADAVFATSAGVDLTIDTSRFVGKSTNPVGDLSAWKQVTLTGNELIAVGDLIVDADRVDVRGNAFRAGTGAVGLHAVRGTTTLRNNLFCSAGEIGARVDGDAVDAAYNLFTAHVRYGAAIAVTDLVATENALWDNDVGLTFTTTTLTAGKNVWDNVVDIDNPVGWPLAGDFFQPTGYPRGVDCVSFDPMPTPPELVAVSVGIDLGPDAPLGDDGDGDNACVGWLCSRGGPGWDCDDARPEAYPGARDLVADGVDDDCDGYEQCYLDGDHDRYGDGETPSDPLCVRRGASALDGDCDDSNDAIHPAAGEIPGDGVDQNCDTSELCYRDNDADGWRTAQTVVSVDLDCVDGVEAAATVPGFDCDDTRNTVFPGATEVVGDGRDQSCDGRELCYVDNDADGWRTNSTLLTTSITCTAAGLATSAAPATDCDDTRAWVNPGANQVCDGYDNTCAGAPEPDGDGDGWLVCAPFVDQDPVDSFVGGGDCDDTTVTISPAASEVCNGVDDSCDGLIDEGLATTLWYTDLDADGVGADPTLQTCQALGPPWVTVGGDCDDSNPQVNPTLPEVCNTIDDDCDALVDEGLATTLWYTDLDGDGFGADPTQQTCQALGPPWVTTGGDCDDAAPGVSPGATETCNGVDDDCDALVDGEDTDLAGGCVPDTAEQRLLTAFDHGCARLEQLEIEPRP